MSYRIPEVLIPKTGTRTSSFWVLVAAWIVGGLFTGLFAMLEAKGYLDREGAPLLRQWLVEFVADLLPVVYVGGSTWLTKHYIQVRGRVAERKAEAMGEYVKAQAADPATDTAGGGTSAAAAGNEK